MKKCLKINLLNIIKTIKEEKNLRKDTKAFLKNKKEKKTQYGHERYKSLPEDEEQELVVIIILFRKFRVFGGSSVGEMRW